MTGRYLRRAPPSEWVANGRYAQIAADAMPQPQGPFSTQIGSPSSTARTLVNKNLAEIPPFG